MKKRRPRAVVKRSALPPDAGTSFDAGVPYLQRVQRQAGLDQTSRVFTSKDAAAAKTLQDLRVTNVPPGFTKWQLPFAAYNPSNFYMTHAKPNAVVDPHAHEHGAGFRVILKGSLVVNGQRLSQGDWFYVPKGTEYSYRVGRSGAQLMSGYECCCQGWPCC